MLPTSSTPSPEAPAKLHAGTHVYRTNTFTIVGIVSYLVLLAVGVWLVPRFYHKGGVSCSDNGKEIVDVFPGAPWRTSQTLSSRLLLSDSRMRIEYHDVQGEDGRVYTDWIWMDVVDQMKYGLNGESLAVCGGQVEMVKKEEPLEAAKRELREEMSLIGSASDWQSLGTYRVNVNRGHGMVSCFLLIDAREEARAAEEFHVDELERQKSVDLTLEEMEQAVRDHAFQEIKWQATASMAVNEVRRRIEEEDRRLGLSTTRVPADNHSSLAGRANVNADHRRPATLTLSRAKKARHDAMVRRGPQGVRTSVRHQVDTVSHAHQHP